MSDTQVAETEPDGKKKGGVVSVGIGLLLATVLGGAGFYATYSGMLDFEPSPNAGHEAEGSALDVTFVQIEPILVSLAGGDQLRHLRFRAHVEVAPGAAETVTSLMPRILDVLNGYLRALDEEELERPSSLIRIRSQMLRRIQIVVGEGRVHDLLVTEFVLN
ncbi:flagellar basal body-associated FliL family protein [Tropicimonas marinistellae]|uniref:flagellar basal body-associated FliL family protein n=1 Tax=Tropicimonas marinistellae TaxID=1739787 RepID=UPI00082B2379|nr:flagellar basal body-associated FliL family protein [Tropicimonas marinistellae]